MKDEEPDHAYLSTTPTMSMTLTFWLLRVRTTAMVVIARWMMTTALTMTCKDEVDDDSSTDDKAEEHMMKAMTGERLMRIKEGKCSTNYG